MKRLTCKGVSLQLGLWWLVYLAREGQSPGHSRDRGGPVCMGYESGGRATLNGPGYRIRHNNSLRAGRYEVLVPKG